MINNNPICLISVIIPVYNVLPYLAQCLDSVLGQSLGQIEIILINDGSSDGSDLVCEDYAKKDNRIRYFSQKNNGLSAARNRGLDEARGEYLFFLDSDDWLEQDSLESIYDFTRKNSADIVYFDSFYYLSSGEKNPNWSNEYIKSGTYLRVEEKKTLLHPCYAWVKIYRRDYIEKYHFRFLCDTYFEDNPWNFQILYHSSKVMGFKKSLVNYRARHDSISGRAYDSVEYLDHINRVIKYEIDYYNDNKKKAWAKHLSRYWLHLSLLHYYRVPHDHRSQFYVSMKNNLKRISPLQVGPGIFQIKLLLIRFFSHHTYSQISKGWVKINRLISNINVSRKFERLLRFTKLGGPITE